MKYLIGLLVGLFLFFGIRYLYFKPKFMIGSQAPHFEAVLMGGDSFSLQDKLKDKIILLDFWGSWCGPCRAENPKIVSLYNQYSEKGFDVVSVGIETNKLAWQKAIIADDLHWENHILQENRFSSPIAELYGVKEIPTGYLIDRDGIILGVNMTIEQMSKVLDAKLPIN